VNPLARKIAQRIRLQGPMTIAAFMADALGHPQHGYYMTADPLGRDGDFITAPDISQMFGELIGLWCAEVWRLMNRPGPFNLIELGPGRGTLMADALRAAKVLAGFNEAAAIRFIETSPALRARQKAALEGCDVTWHDDLGDVPSGPTILIANEFFDALPVHQFERTADGWRERMVTVADDRLVLAPGRHRSPSEILIPEDLRFTAPTGSVVEVSPASVSIMHAIAERLEQEGGAALVIDYGHIEHRTGATLQSVRRHERHDFLTDPGTADLTAHVDFATLAATAHAHTAVHGPVTQGALLQNLGIELRARQLQSHATEAQRQAIEAARRRLIDPAEMGTLFKVLAVCDRALAAPPGFDPVASTG
jgi:NADH dehydrogenase [ubiquinone] 1 alpha subcomplex assembly factor 7